MLTLTHFIFTMNREHVHALIRAVNCRPDGNDYVGMPLDPEAAIARFEDMYTDFLRTYLIKKKHADADVDETKYDDDGDDDYDDDDGTAECVYKSMKGDPDAYTGIGVITYALPCAADDEAVEFAEDNVCKLLADCLRSLGLGIRRK